MLRVGMRLRTLLRPHFSLCFDDPALTMKTLERQRLHSNAERWNDETVGSEHGCWNPVTGMLNRVMKIIICNHAVTIRDTGFLHPCQNNPTLYLDSELQKEQNPRLIIGRAVGEVEPDLRHKA